MGVVTHGLSKTQIYHIWFGIKNRCLNPFCKEYDYYGGRGITICDRWLGSDGFLNFMADIGPRPSPKYSVDRFPNNDGNYEPGNVRWATKKQQQNNTRYNVKFDVDGESLNVTQISEQYGIDRATINYRLRMWGDVQKAITEPVRGQALDIFGDPDELQSIRDILRDPGVHALVGSSEPWKIISAALISFELEIKPE